jgi:hypothetical protein
VTIGIDSIEASLAKAGQICEGGSIGIGALARTSDVDMMLQGNH